MLLVQEEAHHWRTIRLPAVLRVHALSGMRGQGPSDIPPTGPHVCKVQPTKTINSFILMESPRNVIETSSEWKRKPVKHRHRDEPYSAEADDAQTRKNQLDGRRAHARDARPWEYSRQPRVSVNKKTADFSDNDGRRYRILWDEIAGNLEAKSVPVYCKSGPTTKERFMDVIQPNGSLTLSHKATGTQAPVIVRDIGYSSPRSSYSGRLVLDLSTSGLTAAQLAPRK